MSDDFNKRSHINLDSYHLHALVDFLKLVYGGDPLLKKLNLNTIIASSNNSLSDAEIEKKLHEQVKQELLNEIPKNLHIKTLEVWQQLESNHPLELHNFIKELHLLGQSYRQGYFNIFAKHPILTRSSQSFFEENQSPPFPPTITNKSA